MKWIDSWRKKNGAVYCVCCLSAGANLLPCPWNFSGCNTLNGHMSSKEQLLAYVRLAKTHLTLFTVAKSRKAFYIFIKKMSCTFIKLYFVFY